MTDVNFIYIFCVICVHNKQKDLSYDQEKIKFNIAMVNFDLLTEVVSSLSLD